MNNKSKNIIETILLILGATTATVLFLVAVVVVCNYIFETLLKLIK